MLGGLLLKTWGGTAWTAVRPRHGQVHLPMQVVTICCLQHGRFSETAISLSSPQHRGEDTLSCCYMVGYGHLGRINNQSVSL